MSPGGSTARRVHLAVLFTTSVAGLGGGCDLIDVSLTDGSIVVGPRSLTDGGPAPVPPAPSPGPSPLPPVTAATPCQRELVARGVSFSPAAPTNDRPAGRPDLLCAVEDPVVVQPLIQGVTFRPSRVDGRPVAFFAACELASSLGRMAQMLAARGVTDVAYLQIYGCRLVAGTSNLSEHGRARAFDLAALRTAGGDLYTVSSHWERSRAMPVTAGGRFLREVVVSLYEARVFHIILTPDYNAAHANHFHMDLTPGGRLLRTPFVD